MGQVLLAAQPGSGLGHSRRSIAETTTSGLALINRHLRSTPACLKGAMKRHGLNLFGTCRRRTACYIPDRDDGNVGQIAVEFIKHSNLLCRRR